MHGGIAQGVAQALLEAIHYDEDGQPKTTNFADYPVISAAELPSFDLVHMETPTWVNELGAKGVGESGTIGVDPGGLQRGHRRPRPPRRAPPRDAAHAGAGLGRGAGAPRVLRLPDTRERGWATIAPGRADDEHGGSACRRSRQPGHRSAPA